ncbi:MAG: hypothetical protein ACP5R2_06190 [Anaerolineae bacterium]
MPKRRCRRLIWPLALALLFTVLLALPLLATPEGDLSNKPINLSKRAELGLKSADADLDASADGKWVAAVWSLGYDSNPDTAQVGHIVLKSANVITGWERQVYVFTATATQWAQQPRLVFHPSNSSQVAVVWVLCRNKDEQCDTIQMTTCELAAFPDRCQLPQTVRQESGVTLSNPDVAYDGNGVLHFIWRKGSGTGQRGIFYQRAFGVPVFLDQTTQNSFNPSLAWSSDGGGNGRLHLVWYEYTDDSSARRIKYSSDDNLNDNKWPANTQCNWKAPTGYQFTGGTGQPYIKPSIAAYGSHVYLVWDMCQKSEESCDPQDTKFQMAYEHSNDNGLTWLTGCSGGVGKALPGAYFGDEAFLYTSRLLNNVTEQETLRPSVALSGSLPAVAWHTEQMVGENTIYVIGYVSSISVSGVISWQTPVLITHNLNYDPADGVAEDASANPRLAFWPGGRLHLVHMGLWGGNPFDEKSDWDIYYRGYVITDTSSFPTATPTPKPGTPPVPTPTPTRWSSIDPYDDVRKVRLPVIMKR